MKQSPLPPVADSEKTTETAFPAPKADKTTDRSGGEAEAGRLLAHASYISLIVSLVLLVAKFWAYHLTRSQAVFSDATESIVNVIAAALAIGGIAFANKPADRDHPYGHGKIEFFSAAFEGGMIAFASVVIIVEAVRGLLRGSQANEIGLGLVIVLLAGLANALLGIYLIRLGRRHQSVAIEASGHHVVSDFWTSAGVGLGLILVYLTRIWWLDPVVALLVGAYLGYTGVNLVRHSIGGLLDEEDLEVLGHLTKIIVARPAGIIQVHHLRVMRSGRFHHIDAHVVVPEFWNVAEAHARTDDFEEKLMHNYPSPGELHLHMDPCRRAYCRQCDVLDCPIRRENFEKRLDLTIDELTSPDEPPEFERSL